MTAARLVVTADTADWADIAAQEATGYAASVIGCDAEAGVEPTSAPTTPPMAGPASACCLRLHATPWQKAAINRVGQCVLTCATTACYNGLPG